MPDSPSDRAYALRSQARMRHVLAANRSIVGDLSLPSVLRRVVEAARDVVGADYAALGVIATDGTLEQFVHSGMDADTVARIGDLPRGRGLLGALVTDPGPIRLRNLSEDPRSARLPDHHPPMGPFLGLPIQLHGTAFGNLYLANRTGGPEFTFEDEELVLALASTAGIAVENARLYALSRRRQGWLAASGQISRRMLSPVEAERDTLEEVARTVCELASADTVSIVLPSDQPGMLRVAVASGLGAAELTGFTYATAGSIAWPAIQRGQSIIVADVHAHPEIYVHLNAVVPVTQAMVLPLTGEGQLRGAVVLGRVGSRAPFVQDDLEMAETFAQQAALALELAAARAAQQRLIVLEERERIARDLHDHVIQRLFGASLTAQGLAQRSDEATTAEGLVLLVGDLTETIRKIRATIFELEDASATASLRRTALAVVEQLAPVLGTRPELTMSGPLDTITRPELDAEVEAVLRELLTNVARHAGATRVSVGLHASGAGLAVSVRDDGRGLGESGRRSGLHNLRRRAEHLGGDMTTTDRPEGGLEVRWEVPLAPRTTTPPESSSSTTTRSSGEA